MLSMGNVSVLIDCSPVDWVWRAAAAAREADTVVSGGDMSWSSLLTSSLMVVVWGRDGSAAGRCCSSCMASAVILRLAASIWAADGAGMSGTAKRVLIDDFGGGAECADGCWDCCCWIWDCGGGCVGWDCCCIWGGFGCG